MKIIQYPHPTLRKNCELITSFDDELLQRVQQMTELMDESGGVGLAAPQVDWPVRLFLIKRQDKTQLFINPGILSTFGDKHRAEEGCLSIPGVFVHLPRWYGINIKAQTIDGSWYVQELMNIDARVAQHENDHLNGILIIDKASPADRVAAGIK